MVPSVMVMVSVAMMVVTMTMVMMTVPSSRPYRTGGDQRGDDKSNAGKFCFCHEILHFYRDYSYQRITGQGNLFAP